jgi:hypothetical protein
MKTITRPNRIQTTSWVGVVDQLEKLSEWEGVELHITPEEIRTANSAIRSGCYRRGFTAVFRRVPGEDVFRIYRKDGVARPRKFEENKVLADRFINGETLDEIGQSLGVSRQAAEQKVKGVMRFSELPVHKRIEATQRFIQPFLDAVGKRSCILCKEEIKEDSKRSAGMCDSCRRIIKARTLAAARLRAYLADPGNRHSIAEALVLIRKYNFQPEDVARM